MRRTIYPRATPGGYPLAARLAARIGQALAEQAAGVNPAGLVFPSPTGKHWRSSNFNRNVLQRAYLAAGWRDEHGTEAARIWTAAGLGPVLGITPSQSARNTLAAGVPVSYNAAQFLGCRRWKTAAACRCSPRPSATPG